MQSLIDLFGLKDLIPHGYCLSWSPVLLWLNVVSDLLITLSYYSIPLMLVYFIRQRKDLPYPGLAGMFACFIVACGTTHLLSAITIWIPLYWLDGLLKGFTAIISVATAVLMLRVIPGALSAPSAVQLQAEMQQRKVAEHALRESENKLATILDSVEAFIYIKDCNYQYQYANQPVQQVFGKALEDIIGKSDDAFFDEATTAKLRENDRRVLGLGERTAAENIYIHKDSAIARTYFTVKQPLRREDGSIYGLCGISTDITERKQMEEARKEALSRLQKIAGRVPGVVYQYRLRPDGSSCFPFASEAIHDIYRVSPEDVREDGAKVLAILHPDDYDGIGASIQQSARDLTPWRYEYRVKFDDGTVRWLFGNALPQKEADGSTLWHGFITDITERKQMEEKLRDSDAFNVSVLNSLTSHIAVLDAQGVIVVANNAWRQFAQENGLLKSSQDMLGFNYLDACNNAFNQPYGDEASAVREGITAVLDGEREMFHLEYLCHSPNQQHWFYMNVLPLQGSCRGVVVSHKNITERKKAEEVALAASQYARSLIEASLDPLVTISAEGKITDVNTATEQVTGAGRDNLIGSDFADYFTDPEKAREGYQRVFSQGFVTDYPLAIRHVSGKVTDVLYNAGVYRDGNGNVLGVFAAARDITERKVMEDELKNSEAKFRSIIEVSPVPMALNDERLNITFLNPAFVQTFGYTTDDIPTVADWWLKAYPDPDYRRWAESAWQTTLEKAKQEQTGFSPMEVAVRCKNNSVKIVLVTAAEVIHNDVAGMHLVVLYDITERKQIEAELTRSNAELEQFAYAVSHDMRQPLRMVTSYLSLIENALTGQLNEETQQFIDFAVNGAKRMDAMILSLLEYSRVGRVFEAKTRLSSQASLDEALAFLHPELSACGGAIKVTGDWPELFASRDELTRLLQNLIGNALKYHDENQPPQVDVHGTISAGSLRVEVRDRGIGIEPSQRDRLFKVFSRLQARSRFDGTGVGLALCRKIVEHHGGTIGVESAGEGQGCVFWFELPIVNTVISE
ncbi:PAS domain S-box protein [Methylobacter sp.]|uniref:PAS domain-containing sensor histidine kinase n=1 Tax=Methylobacter sp. TaxID=2051955 RepID=UPI0024892175|nr:PAS domain S-box protein [Methylobacter sp.]MDI1275918.1 PAS domain S-box protein [Methylobacter sp.]MDI1356660.1 PAS domain S-box protein [Methylobacter sp.]